MKKFFLKNVAMSLLALLPLIASAYDAQIDGIYYNLDAGTKQATVTYGSSKYTGSVNIPSSVTYDGVTYSVTTIGGSAFSSCTGLTSVKIPNSVTEIGSRAFYYCRGLTAVTIPNSVTEIGYNAFGDCSGLTSITVESGNTVYDSRDSCNAIIESASNTLVAGCKNTVIPNSVTEIGFCAFYGCSGLTSIDIPNSVTKIGDSAFYRTAWYNNQPDGVVYAGNVVYKYKGTMPENTSISIKEGTLGIGNYAFRDCSNLTEVTIPNSVTSIGGGAFLGCSGLTSVKIPNSVTSIGFGAFSPCSGLTSITVESGNTVYDSRDSCNAIIETASNTLIAGCKNTVIPNSVTSIGDCAFDGCTGLTSVTFPNSVTSIGIEAFARCSGLTEVTIPNSVTEIGDYVFAVCSGLTEVTIPNSVTDIGFYAFSDCSGLTKVYCYAENVPNTNSSAFNNVNVSDATLYVPSASIEAYKAATPWSGFGKIVALGGSESNLRGDVNGDGKVSMSDAMFIVNYLLNGKFPDEE